MRISELVTGELIITKNYRYESYLIILNYIYLMAIMGPLVVDDVRFTKFNNDHDSRFDFGF